MRLPGAPQLPLLFTDAGTFPLLRRRLALLASFFLVRFTNGLGQPCRLVRRNRQIDPVAVRLPQHLDLRDGQPQHRD